MTTRNYSFSTTPFTGQHLEPSLSAIAAAGFNGIELTGFGSSRDDWQFADVDDPASPPSGKAASELRRTIEAQGLQVNTFHAPPRTTVLGAPTEAWRSAKVTVLADYLRLAGAMGAAGMVIHGIPNPMFLPKDESISAMHAPMVDAMRRSVDDLLPISEQTGVRLLLENLPYAVEVEGPYPLIAMHQLRPFVDQLPRDLVGLIVDTGHAWTNGDQPVSEIQTAGDRLWGTHLQDVPLEQPNDNHWLPTQGDLDWNAIRAALVGVGYRGAWTFEIRPDPGQTATELARRAYEVAMSWETVQDKWKSAP